MCAQWLFISLSVLRAYHITVTTSTKPGLGPKPDQARPSQGLQARLQILVGLSPSFEAQAGAFRPSLSPHITRNQGEPRTLTKI